MNIAMTFLTVGLSDSHFGETLRIYTLNTYGITCANYCDVHTKTYAQYEREINAALFAETFSLRFQPSTLARSANERTMTRYEGT